MPYTVGAFVMFGLASMHGLGNAAIALLSLLVVAACQGPRAESPPDEASVKPGINKDFLDPKLEVAKYEERFEGESREIFAQRARIAGLLDLKEGMRVADVGAGTGLFTRMFAGKVGEQGTVYAVDIAKQFVEHVEKDGLVLASYDTELFGHWWLEGVDWLEGVIRRSSRVRLLRENAVIWTGDVGDGSAAESAVQADAMVAC